MALQAWLRRWWPVAGLLAVTAALFTVKGLSSFLFLDAPAGRDLAGNYAFTWLMKQNLLHGEVVRWTNSWMLGFPSFAAYPPLFFVLVAGVDILSGGAVDLLTVFTATVFASVFLLPAVVSLSLRDLGSGKAVFAGFFTLYFLFVHPPVSQVYQVLSVGLVAQGFAFLLFFPALGLLFRQDRRSSVLAGVLLGCTVLAHPFVGLTGLIVTGFYVLTTRDRRVLGAAVLGAVVAGPWLLNAAQYLAYLPTYTFGTARIGTSLLLLVPLVLLGGYKTDEEQALLGGFTALLVLGTVELPLLAQEFRFFTYALGIGSILAGIGAYRVYTHLGDDAPRLLLLAVIAAPVIGLSLQADTIHSWEYGGGAGPLLEELREQEPGRVLVETDNQSMYDAYVIQERIPMATRHTAVNELHLDASTSANYLLTLEHWISARPLRNPLCRTCNTSAAPALIDRRLDDLGVRYVVTRTPSGRDTAAATLTLLGRYGSFHLFENTAGHRLVEALDRRPVALVGRYRDWQAVNDRLFTSRTGVPVVWLRQPPAEQDRFSAVIPLAGKAPGTVVQRLQRVGDSPLPPATVEYTVNDSAVHVAANRSVPVRVKVSWSPRHDTRDRMYASNFNTFVVYPSNRTVIRLR